MQQPLRRYADSLTVIANDRLYGLADKIASAKRLLRQAGKKDYYKTLGLENRKASEQEIKKAYKRQAMRWHPDRNSRGTEEERAKADKMFKDINEAYTVLSDRDKRRQYDLGAYDPYGGAAEEQAAPPHF